MSTPASAQIPNVSLTGLPATPLIGEEFCVDASFTNSDTSTGYGPYLIAVVEPQIQQLSIDFVDIAPVLEQIGTFDASGMLVDPISGITLMGVQGGSAWLARYPIGSVDQGQPALVMTVCAVVEPGAAIGVPKDVEVIPGFEFGDTTVGTNGAIVGTPQTSTVTPELARVSKSNSAPEGERPPGPSHPFIYTWTIDVSEGVAIENLVATDVIPADIQWTGGAISLSAPLGVGCSVDNMLTTPGVGTGGGTVEITCASLLGTAGTADLTVTVPVFILDILDGTNGNASSSIVNTVNVSYDYQGTGFVDSDTSSVTAVHAAIQKAVAGSGLPGGRLTYSVSFQVTDYPDSGPSTAMGDFVIDDVIADGLQFDGTLALVINGATVPITPTVIPGPGAGETSVSWDIAAANGGTLPNGTTGSLTYETTILNTYDNGDPVLAADGFDNTADATFETAELGVGNNSSSIQAGIQPNVPDKTIFSPNPVPNVLEPGQEVIFELTLSVPAGNTQDVVFTDFLPRPVFDVADFVQATDLNILPPFAALTPTVTTNASDNSIRMDFGNISTTIASTLRVRLTARIVGTPFADSLFLTNLLQTSYTNTNGDTITELQAVGGTVGAPSLVITKGVIATDNPAATVTPAPPGDPSTVLADSDVSDVDAFDEITFLVTVENVGTTQAYNVTIDDPAAAGYACATPSAGDIEDGTGAILSFTGDLTTGIVLDDPLDENDGTEGAPFGADTALMTLRCTLGAAVEPLQSYTNEAGVIWTSVPDPSSPFTRVTDTAQATVAAPRISKVVTNISPGYSTGTREAHIGEIVTYQITVEVPEGTSTDVRLEDRLPNGFAMVDVISLTPSSPDLSTSEGSFAAVLANAGFNNLGGGLTAPDRRFVIGPGNNDDGFGTITNANSDNSTVETITIVYRVRVLNASVNTNGRNRRNRARWFWQPSGASTSRVQVRAARVRIVESLLRLSKTFTPDDGDDSSPPLVILNLDHANGSNADAFDVALSDLLPNDMFVDGAIDTSSCSTLPDTITVTNVTTSDRIDASWSDFPEGSSCSIRFQTRFALPPPAGAEFQNCAEAFWESLRDGDQPLPMPPTNTLGVERTGNTADPGETNDYQLQACDTFNVFDVGIEKEVLSTDQAHTDSIPGTPPDTESLTIGEEVTFELVLTAPDATIFNLEVTDLLPVTDNVLEFLAARTTSVGVDLTPDDPNPTPVPADRDGDGINDSVTLDYGNVLQVADGITDEDDRIRIEIDAKVRDVLVNRNNNLTSNAGLVRFRPTVVASPSITASDNADLEIVEPLLSIEKTGDKSVAEAGDLVQYTIRIEHEADSRVDAQDLSLNDVIPAELIVVPGSVTTGATCSDAPDSGPSLGGGAITASWTSFPLGAVCDIEFTATISVSAVVGQTIVNEADIAWTSLDTTGDADDRAYTADDLWNLNISQPGLGKSMISTDVDITEFVLGAATQDLTIGETATFELAADFPDGTTDAVIITDQLPTTDVALRITGSRITAIGTDLTNSAMLTVGAAGVDCSGGAQTCVSWDLGDVVNQIDFRPEPDAEDRITFEVDVLVLDDPLNSGAPGEDKNLLNTATAQAVGVSLNATSAFDIVEPLVEISKLTENGTLPAIVIANEVKTFRLVVDHLPDSTAGAVDLVVTDTLDGDVFWVNDSTATSTCTDFNVDSSPAPGTSGTVTFSFSSLTLIEGGCEISYDVQARGAGFPVPDNFPNQATLQWQSAPLPNAESRQGTDSDENRLVSLLTGSISKVVAGTSVNETGTSVGAPLLEDVTIGEQIRYEIVAAFTEGLQSDVVLVDTLQDDDPTGPRLALVGGSVVSIGDNLTTSEPGTPVVAANQITVDYGDVDNFPDGVLDEDDTVIFELIAEVIDVPNNVAGITLNNQVTLSIGGAVLPEIASVNVDVVEPDLNATKTFTDLTEGVATIEIVLSNSGTSAGYELGFTDDFNETFWIPGTLTPVTLPPGFTLTEASAAGTTTVTLATEGDPSKPEEVLAPGETLTVIFTMELVNGGIVGVTQIDNTVNAETTSLPGVNAAERVYTDSATDSLFFPDLSLEKTWTGPNDPARPGDTITYTLTLENVGQAQATNIVIDDTPDALGQFLVGSVVTSGAGVVVTGNAPGDTSINATFPSLAAAASVTVAYDVLVPIPYPDGMTAPEEFTNQATADSKEQQGIISDDPTTGTVDDATIVPIQADPVMTVTKDDQVLLTAPGATIEYLITYGNAGNQDATGVEIGETVPANTVFDAANSSPGWSCPAGSAPGTVCNLLIGDLSLGTATAVFAVVVDNPLGAGVTQIDNTVSVTDDGIEFDGTTPVPSTDNDTETTPIGGANPQLQIEKDDGGIGVTPGQRYSYTIDYANIGNQAATGVVISETVPADVTFSAVASLPNLWSCPNGSPPATVCSITVPLLLGGTNDQARFGLDVVFPAAAGSDLIINTVDITDDGNNSLVPSTDMDSDDTPLIAVPDIYVTKAPDVSITDEGQQIIYTAEYGNQGDQNATGVIVREVVPDGATFNEMGSLPTVWSCSDGDGAGTVCDYAGGAVNVGFMETLMFAINVVDTPSDRLIRNIIESNDDLTNGTDPTPSNNIFVVSTPFPALNIDTMSRGSMALLALLLLYLGSRQQRARRTK
ncbi:MAG: hypothetical protein AAGG55_09820 [Pseudomonadota bacterium]